MKKGKKNGKRRVGKAEIVDLLDDSVDEEEERKQRKTKQKQKVNELIDIGQDSLSNGNR